MSSSDEKRRSFRSTIHDYSRSFTATASPTTFAFRVFSGGSGRSIHSFPYFNGFDFCSGLSSEVYISGGGGLEFKAFLEEVVPSFYYSTSFIHFGAWMGLPSRPLNWVFGCLCDFRALLMGLSFGYDTHS